MSAVERRPVVKGTSLTLTNQSQQAFQATGAVLNIAAKGLSAAAKLAFAGVQQTIALTKTVIKSANELRTTAQSMQQQSIAISRQHGLSETEAHQVAGLAIASSYIVNDPQVLTQAMQALQNNPSANTLESVQASLESAHQQFFVENISLAVSKAAMQIGFSSIPAVATAMVNGKVCLTASDDTGRVLVTEIHSDRNHQISIATEIIGSSDHTCNQILDAFHTALESEGVKMGDRDRKFTGGIIELDAAREFVSRKMKPKAKSAQTAAKKSAARPTAKKSQVQKF